MAETENSEELPIYFRLRLLVDKEKNKVVLAEADKDFVDLLFSFLTLPMATAVRLLEKYQEILKSQAPTIGCFNNLFKSVHDMSTDTFLTEACKEMLLYPKIVNEGSRLNQFSIDDTELLKYYMCPKLGSKSSCFRAYSNFCSSRCSCGTLMDKEFIVPLGKEDGHDEVLVSGKTLLLITDDMKLVTSMGLTLKTLRGLGYRDVNDLHEIHVDVYLNKVFALFECFLSSETPLTDVFLREHRYRDLDPLQDILGSYKVLRTMIERAFDGLFVPQSILKDVILKGPDSVGITRMLKYMPSRLSVNLFISKQEKKVLYVECGKEFVDLLFTFLAIPLKSVWELSRSNAMMGCIGNLCDSYNNMSSNKERNASTSKCMLPWYYSCQRQLLDVFYEVSVASYIFRSRSLICDLKPMDPRCDASSDSTIHCDGFVKRGTMFMVSDDLVITPMNSSKAICLLKKMNADLDDIEEQVINITKTEATSLLRASLLTSTALTTTFSSLLVPKKPKEESSKATMSLLGRLIFSWCNFRFL